MIFIIKYNIDKENIFLKEKLLILLILINIYFIIDYYNKNIEISSDYFEILYF